MGFSTMPLLVVISPSPLGFQNRLSGKLMKGLPQEFRTRQAPVNPTTVAALLGDGCNAGELLHFTGAFKSTAVGAKRGQESWSQRRSCSRKTSKQSRIIMLVKQSRNPPV